MSGDEIEAALEQNVEMGLMEHAGVGEDGQIHYRLTDAGTAHVQGLVRAGMDCPVHGIPDCSPLLNGCSILAGLRRSVDLDGDRQGDNT